MRVLGIIVEYNPFHNGHLYHLDRAKKMVKPDCVVAVMSGNFTQRGEPAIIDKFARAEIALRSGVDLVLELPLVYSIQDAGGFARGSVGILHRLKHVTDLVFGSESADLNSMWSVSKVLFEQPDPFPSLIHKELKKGLSFPNARKNALREYFRIKHDDPEIIRVVESSNDILGIEYLNSILHYGAKIKVEAVKRVGSDYLDERYRGRFSSATSIRREIKEGNLNVLKDLPEWSGKILKREFDAGRGPLFFEDFSSLLLGLMRTMSRDDFKFLYGFTEGLDERFHRFSKFSSNLREFVEMVKTKRFTLSRIRRLTWYPLFKMTKDLIERSNELGPQYIRILGFTEKGRNFLAKIKKKIRIPLISTPSRYREILKYVLKHEDDFDVDPNLFIQQFERDMMATNVYSLHFQNEEFRRGERDMKLRVISI
ncbi:MAG: nucleotidyltransferase [Thermotogae bacterium]|nr:nucleotidyltransferase [Thermotogota bacterium]